LTWTLTARPGRFTPPGWSRFAFGGAPSSGRSATHTTREGRTDEQGRHTLALTLQPCAQPVVVSAEASAQDVNRQTFAGETSLLVHPAAVYVGLRPGARWVRAGEPLRLEVAAVDLEGAAVPGREVRLAFERLSWEWKGGDVRERVLERAARRVTTRAEPVEVRLDAPTGGSWRAGTPAAGAEGRRR